MSVPVLSHAGSFLSGLSADGPANEYADKLMLYGQFVGDWIAETDEYYGGTVTHSTWDIRFDWVLEGRAIQDLWITPAHREPTMPWSTPGNRYSTTLRLYDPRIDAWHIIWANPPAAYVTRQIGRQVGEEIVQLSDITTTGELSRWVYRNIERDSFRWCNENPSTRERRGRWSRRCVPCACLDGTGAEKLLREMFHGKWHSST